MQLATTVFWSVIVPIFVTLLVLFVRELLTGSAKSYFGRIQQNIEAKNARELETLKTELRSQADVDLERERAGLRVLTESYLSRASHLAERRLDMLVELYRLTLDTQSTLSPLVNPAKVYLGTQDPDEIKKAEQALENAARVAFESFHEFVPPNRIFLDEATCAQVDAYRAELSRILHDFRDGSIKGYVNPKLWESAHVRTKELLPSLIEGLRRQIGALIGVEDSAPKQ